MLLISIILEGLLDAIQRVQLRNDLFLAKITPVAGTTFRTQIRPPSTIGVNQIARFSKSGNLFEPDLQNVARGPRKIVRAIGTCCLCLSADVEAMSRFQKFLFSKHK